MLSAGSPVYVGQGSSASTYVNVFGQYGFNGSVNLAATNLPSGVTASFSTNPTTSASTVTFTASSTTPVGLNTVTITGTSGALTASTTIVLNVIAPTFTLQTSGILTLGQGSSTSSYVDVMDEYGFSGSVGLSVSGLPKGVTAIWGPNPTTSNTSLYLYANGTVTPGQYLVTITGISGAITATTSFTLTVAVPTYTIYTGGTVTVGQGLSGSSYIDINREYGFSGAVTLSISGLPNGATASISPNSLTGTASYSSVAFQASASAAPGQYPLTVTGVSGGQTVTGSMTLVVSPPSFTLSSSGSMNLGQGLSGPAYVYVYGRNGFSGSVNLAVSGLPNGVTASFSPNPTTSYTNMLTLTAASTVSVGQYPLTITGTSGSLTETTTMTLYVGMPSFTLSTYGVTVGQGQSSSAAVYMSTVYGFNSPVTLSVSGLPSGVTASFPTNPTTAYYNQLTFNVASSVPVGQYPLLITGTAGSLTETTTVTLTVGAPSFALSTYSYPTIGQGSTGTGYIYVNSQNGFNGNVSLSISGLPSGVTATFGTNPTTYSSSILFTVADTAAVGSSTLIITGTSGSLTQTSTMTLNVAAPTFSLYGPYSVSVNQGASANSSVNVSPQYGFTGNVTLSPSGLPDGVSATFSPNPATGSSTMTISASSTAAAGATTFTITGTSSTVTQSMQAQVVVNAASYSLSAAPNEIFVAPGASGKSTISVVPVNGFAKGVNLSASGLPAGITATFSPATETTSGTLTLTASSTAAAGRSTLVVTGTSGAETASVPLQLIITSGAETITSTTLAITAAGTPVTTVSLGTPVTATATVNAGSSPVSAGQVYLCDTGVVYCDAVHQLATAQLNSGNAVFRFVPGIGAHTYKAVFVSTTANANSTSAASPLTVTASLPTATKLSQSGTTGNYTLTATVTGQGRVAPTGNVSFVDTSSGNAVLASSAAASSSTTLTESVAQTIPVGSSPTYMVSADFNGDGIPDLAVVNTSSSTVSILLGSSHGTFTAGTPLQLGTTPGPIAVGDFNGDGKADIAVSLPSSSAIAVFLGNGDGTFTGSTSPVYTAPQPGSLVVADLNGDGLQDLAVLSQGSSSVTILLGHGDGTFTPSNFSPSSGSSPQSVVQADFNGDGVPDLAITNYYSEGVTILLGNGDGTFTAAPTVSTTTYPYSIAVGDFNQDGKPDLAVGTNGGTTVLLGNGDGTFTAASNALSSGYIMSLAVADMNNDGKPDLIAVDGNNSKLTVLLGNGDGTFMTGATQTIRSQPEAAVVGDWNGDGIADVAVVNYYGSSVTTVTTQLTHKVVATANNISPYGTGQHTITATYPGDTDYTGSASGTVTLTAQPGATVVTVNPSTTTLATTQQLAVNIAVSGATSTGYPAPTGTVTLTSGSYSSSPVALSGGGAVVNVPASILAAGANTLTVSYTPDSSTYASSTGSATVTVSKVTPNISISAATSLTVSVQITDPVGTGVPSGTITLTSGAYTSAAVTLTSGSGTITVPAGTLPVGTDTVTINYTPDTTGAQLYNATSATRNISEAQNAPTITWNTPAAITYGTAIGSTQLNATSSTPGTFNYTPAAGVVLPAGQAILSVTFTPTDAANYSTATSSVSLAVNKAPLSISANNASRVYGAANPAFSGGVTGAVNGDTFSEAFSTSATASSPAGTYTIVPSVSGANTADYAVSAANGTLTIAPAPTTTAFALSSQNLTLTATVTSTSGVPTGPVTFYAGQTLLGTGTLNNGSASITLTSFPSGGVSLNAQYGGDGNFAGSASAPVPVLSLAAASTSLTVSSAGTVTDTFSVGVVAGYTGTLQFSCAGLPQNAKCDFQPASITFSGSTTTASTVLTVGTGGLARLDLNPFRNSDAEAIHWTMSIGPGMLALLFVGRRRRWSASLRVMSVLVLCSAAIAFTGCGGSGSSSSTQPTNPVTPSGQYTIQVIATGPSGVSQSTAVSLTVQ